MSDNRRVQATGPLAGLTVLDLTSVILGPLATQMLGDMGADVIKVESPDGDIIRYAEPARHRGMGAVFLNANRNKRSIVIDLKKPEGRGVVCDLARRADVFVHSMRPQAIAKLGLAYDDVAALNSRIVYCSVWGFGSGGPYAERPAYDDVIQGMSGLSDLFARRSGGAPEFAPTILADKVTGITAYGAIVTALLHRERTGRGQEVEVPMFETMAAFNLVEHLAGEAFEPAVGPPGYDRTIAPERRPFQTADGFIAVLPYTTQHWVRFFEAAGRPDLCTAPMVVDPVERSRNVRRLYAVVAELIVGASTEAWLERLRAADIPCVPIMKLEDLARDAHLQAVGFFGTREHPTEGTLRTTKVPVRFSDSPGDAFRSPPPGLGGDTRAVLTELGYDDRHIEALIDAGAVRQAGEGV